MLKQSKDIKIDEENIENINQMYIESPEFIKMYIPEYQKIEKSLSFLKYVNYNYFYISFNIDISAIDKICKISKSLNILKESLRRYVLNN